MVYRTWKTRSSLFVELDVLEDRIVWTHNPDRTLPEELRQQMPPGYVSSDHNWYELIIDFESDGYYDSGSRHGGSLGVGWAPEGSDERTLIEAYLLKHRDNGRQRVLLPKDLQERLFDLFFSEVEEVEITWDD